MKWWVICGMKNAANRLTGKSIQSENADLPSLLTIHVSGFWFLVCGREVAELRFIDSQFPTIERPKGASWFNGKIDSP